LIASVATGLPGAGLGFAAGFAGVVSGLGLALLGAGVAYLVGGLLLWQRHLAARGAAVNDAAGEFLQRALALRSIDDVAAEFARAARAGLGAERALLIAPNPGGGIRAVGGPGSGEIALSDAAEALVWLGDRAEPIGRSELEARREFPGATAALALLSRLGGDTLLPLRHRGVLLGVGVIGGATRSAADGFYQAMRAYTTAAMANTFLDAETRVRSQLARTFDLATAMQEALMPDERAVRRPTFELRGTFRPVAECGGDIWLWRELAQGRLLVLIGDATGHGAAPALLAAVAKGAVDAHWQMHGADLDPGQLLCALNRSIYRVGRTRYMMTAFAAVLDKTNEVVRFANAGQNFPYFIVAPGADKPRVEVLVARGNTLGAAAEAVYETHQRPMRPRDKLVLYTDGVIDAGAPTMQPWGERRLRATLQSVARERATRIPELIMHEVDRYLGGVELSDDITLAVAELGPTGASAKD
jgi:serine phosphatase RsbU (regulator of sigma subunit)